jgi:membrane glycosyltransferase
LLVGCGFDLLFNLLVWPVVMLSQTRFMIGLMSGRRLGWDGQAREASRLRLREAARPFRLHAALGAAGLAVLAWRAPAVLPWASVPFGAWVLAGLVAWGSALPSVGAWMRRHLICAVPDEIAPDPVLRRLAEALTS